MQVAGASFHSGAGRIVPTGSSFSAIGWPLGILYGGFAPFPLRSGTLEIFGSLVTPEIRGRGEAPIHTVRLSPLPLVICK
jgi:hypothetical protein